MSLRKSAEARQAEQERRQRERKQFAARNKEIAEREREKKQALRRERASNRSATTTLRWLGVAVRDGQVYKNDFSVAMGKEGRRLGDLAGARAEVTGGRAGHRRSGGARTVDAVVATSVLGPLGLLAGASRKGVQGTAFVVFADGTCTRRGSQTMHHSYGRKPTRCGSTRWQRPLVPLQRGLCQP
jgi:hypothetical protein